MAEAVAVAAAVAATVAVGGAVSAAVADSVERHAASANDIFNKSRTRARTREN